MAEQGQATDGVIHFSCDHCEISLTVDDSLAGVTGPCPSCGEAITAPQAGADPQKVAVRPRDMKGRGVVATNNKVQRSPQKPSGQAVRSEEGHRRRSVSPEAGISETHRERAEIVTVVKMLVAGLLVLVAILAVTYWLNHRFDA